MLELIIFGIIVGCVFIFLLFAGCCYLIKSMSANLFLVKFNNLLDKDEFIDKKTIYNLNKRYAFAYRLFNIFHNDNIDEFISTYQNLEKEIDKHNEQFVKDEKDRYFNLFSNIDNKSLDEQQKTVCVRNQNATLVIAGAGTGKTLTICGKVKYLLSKGIKANELLLISFTNKACDELSERLTKISNTNIKAQTFHKFALNVIDEKLKIADENYAYRVVGEIFRELVNSDFEFQYMFLEEFADEYAKYLKEQSEQEKHNDEIKELLDKNSELKFLKDLEHIDIGDTLTTFNKEKVKSHYERTIANVLYLLGIKYEYESFYQTDLEIDKKHKWLKTYKPDFYLPEFNIYIEHFANPNWFQDKEERAKYKRQMRDKIKAHKKYKTNLICSHSSYGEDLIKKLLENLKKYNINVNVDIQEILNNIEQLKEIDFIHNKIKNFQTFIKLFKNNNYTADKFIKFKEENGERSHFIKMVEKIYWLYQKHLKENNMLDFEDIINVANHKLSRYKSHQNKYKYVIVDEYQDVSKNKVELLNNLIRIYDCRLLCVGDDWQSIYRFAGSDTNLFTSFEKYINFSELLKIETTYRNSQELINASSYFIQQNNSQIKKQLTSNKHIEKPILIDYLESFEFKTIVNLSEQDKKNIKKCSKLKLLKDDARIKKLIKFLDFTVSKNYKEILILGRNNFDIEIFEALPYAMPDLFKKDKSNYDTNVLEYKSLKLTCMTIHKSKGLEADAVVLWNIREGVRGLPDTKGDDEDLGQVLTQPDGMKYAEDRRLFYVALTRTKNEVLIIALNGHLSSFVNELINNQSQYIATNRALCQKCGAKMIFHKDYNFYGCSNYRLTGCDYKIQNAKDFLYTQDLPTPVCQSKYVSINKTLKDKSIKELSKQTNISKPITEENKSIIEDFLNGSDYFNLSAKYLLYVKDIKEILTRYGVIDAYGNITKEYSKKYKPKKEDTFICGWLTESIYNEWLAKGLIAKKYKEQNQEKYKQEKEHLAKLKKKVFTNKEIEITHPDIDGIWKIKILPVHYVVRPKGNPNMFGIQEMERVRVCEANIKENTIAEDTPLAQAILHKFEGEEYSYNIGNETITGKIVKVY